MGASVHSIISCVFDGCECLSRESRRAIEPESTTPFVANCIRRTTRNFTHECRVALANAAPMRASVRCARRDNVVHRRRGSRTHSRVEAALDRRPIARRRRRSSARWSATSLQVCRRHVDVHTHQHQHHSTTFACQNAGLYANSPERQWHQTTIESQCSSEHVVPTIGVSQRTLYHALIHTDPLAPLIAASVPDATRCG